MGGNYVSVGGHQVGKTAKNGLGSSVSGSATSGGVDHSHISPSPAGTQGVGSYIFPYQGPWVFDSYQNSNAPTTGASAYNHTHSLSATASVSGDNETRPTNRGVRYIIKV